jgi:hypothetical protein|tara:strand:- start:371 stop:1234 length:864 start_codon:yes stop_codon:yes gene_type:complete
MTEQVNIEETANPYNSKKDYMDGNEDKPFVSSNSLFFDETSSETSNVEEVSVEEEVQSEDKPYQRPDYKKRYDDLKRHYDSKLNEFKTREQELLDEALKNRPDYVAPKTPEELEAFKKEYPDVFEVVETVAHMQSSEKAKVLEEQLSTLQAREQETLQRQALTRLRERHPDFEDIKNSATFQQWAKTQPESIQNWIFSNSDDADLASRALDLFKRDIGLDASSVQEPQLRSENRANAADMVSTKTTSVDPKTAKVWTEKEISQLSMAEFDKFEEEISNAMQEGRIVR